MMMITVCLSTGVKSMRDEISIPYLCRNINRYISKRAARAWKLVVIHSCNDACTLRGQLSWCENVQPSFQGIFFFSPFSVPCWFSGRSSFTQHNISRKKFLKILIIKYGLDKALFITACLITPYFENPVKYEKN